ncbi:MULTISPECIES: PrsW family intramembrane metalloprotease [unclassified Microbacterium]|uniref:PrsW family intramembrane metalloprotease n=1 Tax=unclassified Microbacterium TaxID=2609290 RepID=UPI00214C5421|nr:MULTISPECIES: PrsW family intramembrane metalloprotease [unclassified Microbacterium]MCR2786040.1 PrsW family intramembrane metalloprotease [Microbacterium sp. zg.B96]WIM16929.1 PrsW family intramembrane metalloprotease [Microbacterium sp. zg-B96]
MLKLVSYTSALSQPHPGRPAIIAPAPASPPVLPVPPRKGRTAPIWIAGVLVVLLVALAAYLLTFLGAAASLIGMLLALVPFVGVLLAVRIADRWEPEPRSLVALAVAWGAIAAVVITLAIDLVLTLVIGDDGSAARDAFSSVIQAPIVEELAKGLGLLIIFVVGRRAFDGPIDGVVYGALVGAGFAFTENILYFATSLIEGGVAETTVTFFLRGILSPFAHVMFTAVTGYALGRVARDGAPVGRVMRAWLVGMLGAAVLHALWNGSAVFANFFSLYVSLQVPLFALFIVGVLLLLREEARLTEARLGEYAAAGWFSKGEVAMLATGAGRRRAMAWARTLPGGRAGAMKAFIADATALAAARQRALSGRDANAAEDERIFLARAVAARAAVFGQ